MSRIMVLGILVLGLWNGVGHQDHLLIWACGFVLLCLAWAGLTVLATVAMTRRAAPRTHHLSLMEGQVRGASLTGWRLHLPRSVPVAHLSWTLNEVPTTWTRQKGVLSERAHFHRRRLDLHITRRFQAQDALGFFRWSWSQQWTERLRVLPDVDTSRALAPPIGVVAGADLPDPFSAESGDRLDMRRYRKGDPLRLILWPIYQRSGHVMVRAPEKAVSQHQRAGLYILNGPFDNPAAALARVLLEKGALGSGWRFGAEGSGLPWAHQLGASLDALAAGGCRESKEYDLRRFLEDLAGDRFGKCLILVSPDPENRNHKLSFLAHGERLSRIGIDIWVVVERGDAPARNTFPSIAGAPMSLIERQDNTFKLVNW